MEVTFFVAFTNDYSKTADTSFSELEILAIRMVCQNIRPFMRPKIRTFVTLLQALYNVSTTTNKAADEVLDGNYKTSSKNEKAGCTNRVGRCTFN